MRDGLSGQRGRLRFAGRLPTADSLCDLKVARASKISGRKFSAVARQNPARLTSAEMVALRCNAAARMGFFLAALHSVAKRVRRGQAYHPTRFRPRWPERPSRTPPPPRSAASVPDAERSRMSPRVEKIARFGALVLAEPLGVTCSFPSSGKWDRPSHAG